MHFIVLIVMQMDMRSHSFDAEDMRSHSFDAEKDMRSHSFDAEDMRSHSFIYCFIFQPFLYLEETSFFRRDNPGKI